MWKLIWVKTPLDFFPARTAPLRHFYNLLSFKLATFSIRDEFEISCLHSGCVFSHKAGKNWGSFGVSRGWWDQVSDLRKEWLPFDERVPGEQLLRQKLFRDHQQHHRETWQLLKLHKFYSLFAVCTAMQTKHGRTLASMPRCLRGICSGMWGPNGLQWIELVEAAMQFAAYWQNRREVFQATGFQIFH